jgi:hypothetical protein
MGVSVQHWVIAIHLCLVTIMLAGALSLAQSEPWKTEDDEIESGKIVLGMGAGYAPLTQH